MRLLLEYEAADVWNRLAPSEREKIIGNAWDQITYSKNIWAELPRNVQYLAVGFSCSA